MPAMNDRQNILGKYLHLQLIWQVDCDTLIMISAHECSVSKCLCVGLVWTK